MLNRVELIGRLGADPETKFLPSGGQVTSIRLATTRRWFDKQTNERKEESEWHRVVFFAKLAEIVSQYVKKGSLIRVEGRIRTHKWQDQQGQDRYTTEIVAEEMLMLDGKQDNDAQQGNQQPRQSTQQRPSQAAAPTAPGAAPGYDDFDDDIPFQNEPKLLAKHHLI
jgi:single-strand DNA-binding protein